MRDVTERKVLEEQLRHQALHDPLTKLANRTRFTDRLEHALVRGPSGTAPGGCTVHGSRQLQGRQ